MLFVQLRIAQLVIRNMARGAAAASERAGFERFRTCAGGSCCWRCSGPRQLIARSALGSAAPTLVKSMHMSTQQYSYVVSAFQLAYTAVQPLAGILLDLLGTRIGLTVFAVAWSLANMAHALATGWPQLAVFRGLLGLSRGCRDPGGSEGRGGMVPRP
jgi:MFS family permease